MAEKKNGAAGPTKVDGVRRAMASLGGDAKPLAIQKYMKDKLGIDISTGVISAYKKEFAKRAAKAQGAKPAAAVVKGAAQVKPAAAPATPAKPAGTKPAIPLDDILTVKALVGRLGAGPLKTLIDAFAG